MFESAGTGGGFLKPANHLNDLAILFEPTSIRKNVPHEYQGVKTERDEIRADVTVFRNEADLSLGEPQVMSGVTIAASVLVEELEPFIGKKVLNTIRRPKRAYVFGDVPNPIKEQVAAYVTKRDAERTEAADEMAALLG